MCWGGGGWGEQSNPRVNSTLGSCSRKVGLQLIRRTVDYPCSLPTFYLKGKREAVVLCDNQKKGNKKYIFVMELLYICRKRLAIQHCKILGFFIYNICWDT